MWLTRLRPIAAALGKKPDRAIGFADLTEMPDEALAPPLDRATDRTAALTTDQANWQRDGAAIKRGFIPDALIDRYVAARRDIPPRGWQTPVPYMQVAELRELALYPPLMAAMKEIVGEAMLLHLALTGWVSTERDWHQDAYLSPSFVNGWYAAVWIALDTIHPDSGPFEYVPGSHRWPVMDGEKVRSFLTRKELATINPATGANQWEMIAERFTTPAVAAELRRRNSPIERFLAEKGDVLIWHSRLMHRGSLPRVPGMERRALITHYTGINHRPDMPARAQDSNGESYAVFDMPLRV